MQIVHFGHSCVLIDTGSARLLLDPGTFSTGFEDLTGLDAILITHQHFDHLDEQKLPALVAANPGARLVVDEGSAEKVAALGLELTVARPGDALELGGAAVNVVGGRHAVIHSDIPVIPNAGYVIEHGAFYHPGDSFFVPEQEIDVLGLPTGAPWLKAGEAVDFLRAVAPRVAVPIHEAVLANPHLHYGLFANLAPTGSTVTVLPRGELTEV
ncbi:MAG TPA: MBL fold metallo-hydrolase [Pseudonocardiaceae bacterium]|jgi:L-ascorbate metabolism protein UlaG (beta-lactamase superfamily)|nr:MBL fold metallo-hydrolase [Pseudonocardiaceae bacterium]